MTRQPSHFLLAAAAGLGLLMSQSAHATACPMGVLCDKITLNLKTSQLDDGRWRYDYTVEDLYTPYNPGGPEIPVSIGYTFVELRLPYFDDAGITGIQVGSDYAGRLTAQVSDDDLGKAGRSIVVSAGDNPIDTISPTAVVSGVNSLLSFVSDYAPAWNAPATVSLVNRTHILGPADEIVVFENALIDPQHFHPWLSGDVGAPGSPSAVPEAGSTLLALAGLVSVAFTQRRRHRMTPIGIQDRQPRAGMTTPPGPRHGRRRHRVTPRAGVYL